MFDTRAPLNQQLRHDKAQRARRWDVDHEGYPSHQGRHGVATADAWLEKGVLALSHLGVIMQVQGSDALAAVTIRCVPGLKTTLSIPCNFPDTMLASCAGRRFGDIVHLGRPGHQEIDDAAAQTRIAEVDRLPAGVKFTFVPTACLPYDEDNDEKARRVMRLAPAIF